MRPLVSGEFCLQYQHPTAVPVSSSAVNDSFQTVSALLWRPFGVSRVSMEQFLRSSTRNLYLYSQLSRHGSVTVQYSIYPRAPSHYRVARGIKYNLLHTDRYARYRRLAYTHLHTGHLIEARRPIGVSEGSQTTTPMRAR